MKHFFKNTINFFSVFILIIFLFVLFLTLSSSFSSKLIKNNVEKSAKILYKEGNRKYIYIIEKNKKMEFDNFTDALMINTAYSIDNTKMLYSSLIARRNYIPKVTQKVNIDSVGELTLVSKYKKQHNEVKELKDTVNKNIKESFEYARYWHGYLTLLRPLLLIFDINAIRILLSISLILLGIIVLVDIYKKFGILYMISFLMGLIGIEYFYIGISIQGFFIFLISMVSAIFILKKYNTIKNINIIFFIIGMITNFFDLLTNPQITLGLPLIIYFLMLQNEEELSIKKTIIVFLKTCIPWFFGYAITWFFKWILVTIICNRPKIIKTSLSQVLFRSKGTYKISTGLVILQNLTYIIYHLAITIIALMLLFNIKKNNNHLKGKKIIEETLPYIIICLIPYIWYIIIKDHSYQHAFFTYRNQILTLITIPIICFKYLNINKK